MKMSCFVSAKLRIMLTYMLIYLVAGKASFLLGIYESRFIIGD
jgi:hypothetical protein